MTVNKLKMKPQNGKSALPAPDDISVLFIGTWDIYYKFMPDFVDKYATCTVGAREGVKGRARKD
jgi:hypothetical protein